MSARGASSRASSRAATPSRSACATAVRCSRCCKELIPGAQHWPRFLRNRSEQFEARLSLVRDRRSPSVLLAGMQRLAAAGRGRARRGPAAVRARGDLQRCLEQRLIAFRYVTNRGERATQLSGQSQRGGARHRGADHAGWPRHRSPCRTPSACIARVQNSWHPHDAGEDSGWMRLFRNARVWLG